MVVNGVTSKEVSAPENECYLNFWNRIFPMCSTWSYDLVDLWVILKSLWSFAHVVRQDQVNRAQNLDRTERVCETFVYSIVIKIVWLSNMADTFFEKFTWYAKACGLFSWSVCFADTDWLGRQTLITWLHFKSEVYERIYLNLPQITSFPGIPGSCLLVSWGATQRTVDAKEEKLWDRWNRFAPMQQGLRAGQGRCTKPHLCKGRHLECSDAHLPR